MGRGGLITFWLVLCVLILGGAIAGWSMSFVWFSEKVLPGLFLAALISWLIPRAMERYKGRRDHLYKTVDLLREQIREYQKAAVASWQTSQTQQSIAPIEQDLDYLHKDIIALMQLATNVGVDGLWRGPDSPGVKSVSSLAAAAIGPPVGPGNTRKPDSSRVSQINEAAIALMSLLLQERWKALNRY